MVKEDVVETIPGLGSSVAASASTLLRSRTPHAESDHERSEGESRCAQAAH